MGTLNQKNKNKQDDETEIDLGKLFKALVRRLPIILLVTLCFSAIGFSYGKYYLPLEYTSSTYMYVKNGDASEEKTAINQQDSGYPKFQNALRSKMGSFLPLNSKMQFPCRRTATQKY